VKQKLIYITFGVLCSLLVGGILFLASRPPDGSAILLLPPPTPRLWIVQISGAVIRPGVYELPAGSRVRDAVQAAGGLSPEANPAGINLAAFVQDGQSIVIQADIPSTLPAQRGESPSITIEPDSPQVVSAGLININTADLDELVKLPDIGEKIAQRIIDYRTQNGPFETIEEILNVPGIGQVTFKTIENMITVEP
jgi:competence protein ComEA